MLCFITSIDISFDVCTESWLEMTQIFNVLLAVVGLSIANIAHSDENLFAYTYTADTVPKGGLEFNTTMTNRWDKGRGSYYGADFDFELEYGVTSKFQVSGYLNAQHVNHKDAFPFSQAEGFNDTDALYPDRRQTRWNGGKVQFKYNFTSPYVDWMGFSMFIEPQYRKHFKIDGSDTDQREIELGFIFQKNFLDDKLVLAHNLILSQERRILKEDDNLLENEREMTNSLGVTYRFAPGWFAGVETRHHMDVLQQEDGAYKKNQYSWYLGPTIHYANEKWRLTAGYLRQIKGNPEYSAGVLPVIGEVGSNLHLDENEKNELRLRVSYDF